MDFAALMAKEISKAKPSADKEEKNKYTRRAEVEAARIAAYNAEQERLQREREDKATLKRKHEEEEAERHREREEKKRKMAEESKKRREAEEEATERARRKRLGLPELPPKKQDDEDGTPVPEEDIDGEELAKKLRDMDEPVTLFGETHKAKLRRYHRLVQRSLTPQLSNGPIPTTLELVAEKDMKIPTTMPKDSEGKKFLVRQLASYFNMILEEWAIALAKRDLSVKQSLPGRQAYQAMVQSKENMRPLFKKFESAEIDDTVLEAIVEIVHCAQERRYVDANNGYLRLSIGKACVSLSQFIPKKRVYKN
jgi:pre-mRNA-splicing factor 18